MDECTPDGVYDVDDEKGAQTATVSVMQRTVRLRAVRVMMMKKAASTALDVLSEPCTYLQFDGVDDYAEGPTHLDSQEPLHGRMVDLSQLTTLRHPVQAGTGFKAAAHSVLDRSPRQQMAVVAVVPCTLTSSTTTGDARKSNSVGATRRHP